MKASLNHPKHMANEFFTLTYILSFFPEIFTQLYMKKYLSTATLVGSVRSQKLFQEHLVSNPYNYLEVHFHYTPFF
jgi:hypothetical protein